MLVAKSCVWFLSIFAYSSSVFRSSLASADGVGPAVVAACDTVCSCTEKKNNFNSVEFRAICDGSGAKAVILNGTIFRDEPKPNFTRKVYVRLSNFTGAEIHDTFLSRWTSYTTCSFDIWHSKSVSFPSVAPPMANTGALTFVFAGIGVVGSTIQKFPNNIFERKDSVGLKISKSKIYSLNLSKLSILKLNYLILNNSKVISFEGTPDASLKFKNSIVRGPSKVRIENSHIGAMGPEALAFQDHDSPIKANLRIVNTTIWLLEESSLSIGKGASVEILDSHLPQVSPLAFKFRNRGEDTTTIKNNILGLERKSIRTIKCDTSTVITENYIYPKLELVQCLFKNNESHLNCSGVFEPSNYVDESCENNYVLRRREPPRPKQERTDPDIFLPSNHSRFVSDAKETPSVPLGLFYLVLALCLFLILMVVVLACFVVWGKKPNRKNESSFKSRKTKHVSSIYEEPNAYFVPTLPRPPSPLKANLDMLDHEEDFEHERYHIITTNERRKSVRDDSVYLNMDKLLNQ